MKLKIILSLLILFLILAFNTNSIPEKSTLLSSTNPPPTWNGDIKFIIGCHSSGVETNLNILKNTLGFNFWLRYLGSSEWDNTSHYWYPTGWTNDDKLFTTGTPSSVHQILDNNWSNDIKLKTIMHRPKIEWLAFGSRSDYQCERIAYLHSTLQDYWFYTYKDTLNTVGNYYIDDTQYGENEYIRGKFCSPNYTTDGGQTFLQMNPGYVVRDLRTNREQINTHNTTYGQPYPGFGDRQFDWYVLPRIKINPSDAIASKRVCRIDVYNYNNTIILSQDIYGDNFKNTSNQYTGNYLDEYFTKDEHSINLIVARNQNQNENTNFFNPDGKNKMDPSTCYVDFKVWWYGECDMWIDRIRVEDDRAYNLFGDPNTNQTALRYQQILNDEKELALYQGSIGSPYRFYTEEYEFKHLPCMKKVYDKIRESGVQAMFYGNPGGGWYGDATAFLGVPNYDLGVEHYIHHFIDSLNPKENFYGDYPIYCDYYYNGNWVPSKIPNTLPNNGPFNLLSVPPSQYDDWLQWFLEEKSWFYSLLKEGKQISDARDVNLISPIQLHSLNGGGDGELREPTSEEIEMMVNTSLSYGAKGIIYNQYVSWGTENLNSSFSRGLTEPYDPINNVYPPRYTNNYGEPKWQKVYVFKTFWTLIV